MQTVLCCGLTQNGELRFRDFAILFIDLRMLTIRTDGKNAGSHYDFSVPDLSNPKLKMAAVRGANPHEI